MEHFRLDKLVSDFFKITRKQAKADISGGNITVNGQVIRRSSVHCSTSDLICRNGVEGKYQKYVYIMMNKPEGVLSATKDTRAKTAVDLLPEDLYQRDLFVAGRLDKNTTGFLLLTNDGDFAHKILSPKKHVPKTYVATLEKEIRNEDVAAFQKGIRLKDFVCKPAKLEPCGCKKARVTIVEGKFHQIKRMFHSIDNEVISLHRCQMGELALDVNLLPGQARYILDEELSLIKGEK